MNNKKSVLGYMLVCLLLAYLAGCDDNNSLHQQYIDQGETFYTGKCDSVKVFAGNERVKFTWLINSDPRINKTLIYWNEGKDSVEIPVTRTQKGYIQMETIQQMKEGTYNFIFVTMDANGHSSMNVEKSIQIYGSKYISALSNRGLSFHLSGSNLTIDWVPVESELEQYTTVTYTDYSNPANPEIKSLIVANDVELTLIPNVKAGDIFSVVTTFLPENGMDSVDALPIEYTIMKEPWHFFEKSLDKTKFLEVALPGDNNSTNGNRPLPLIWDNNKSTFWHTEYDKSPFDFFPMYFTIDLGVTAKVSRFKIWNRINQYYIGMALKTFEVWGAKAYKPDMLESYWTGNDWKNDWEKLGDFELKRPSGETDDIKTPTGIDLEVSESGHEYVFPNDAQNMRYLRFVVKTVWGTTKGMVMAEIEIFGDDTVEE
jgi:hypothetical protein